MTLRTPSIDEDTEWTLERRREFMRLPRAERTRLLELQAKRMAGYYNSPEEARARIEWQGGDVAEP